MMAITPPSSAQSLNGAVWAQLQQQQAQRQADQAELNARSLQIKAHEAQNEASRAQENARTVKVEYTQAQDKVGSAKQNLASLKSVGELQQGLQTLRDQISSSSFSTASTADTSATSTAASAGLSGVLNAYGQQTGTLVNVSA
jgi:chromosome segregation ATPase